MNNLTINYAITQELLNILLKRRSKNKQIKDLDKLYSLIAYNASAITRFTDAELKQFFFSLKNFDRFFTERQYDKIVDLLTN